MRNRFKALEIRLEDYGTWLVTPIPGLSCPSQTAEAVLIDYNQRIDSGLRSYAPEYSRSPREQETHRAVLDMPAEWQEAIFIKYAARLRPFEAVKALDCSNKHYNILINESLAYLSGKLGYTF